MTAFCRTHLPARTRAELEARKAELEARLKLTPHLQDELARIRLRLFELSQSPVHILNDD